MHVELAVRFPSCLPDFTAGFKQLIRLISLVPIAAPRECPGGHATMAQDIEFVVKNPSRPQQEDFRLSVPASGTVRDVKLQLQRAYPGNPEPSSITVSQGGAGPRHPTGWGRWLRRRRSAATAGTTSLLPGAP